MIEMCLFFIILFIIHYSVTLMTTITTAQRRPFRKRVYGSTYGRIPDLSDDEFEAASHFWNVLEE